MKHKNLHIINKNLVIHEKVFRWSNFSYFEFDRKINKDYIAANKNSYIELLQILGFDYNFIDTINKTDHKDKNFMSYSERKCFEELKINCDPNDEESKRKIKVIDSYESHSTSYLKRCGFRYGQRALINKRGNIEITWKTKSKEKCFTQFKNDYHELGITQEALLKNIFCRYPMNNTPNRKRDFTALKMYDENLYNHAIHLSTTIGLSQKPNNNILILDFDGDYDNSKFIETMNLLKWPEIILMEESMVSGGKHVYIKYDKIIPDELKQKIKDTTHIESVWLNNIIRLPGSYEYKIVNIKASNIKNLDFKYYDIHNLNEIQQAIIDSLTLSKKGSQNSLYKLARIFNYNMSSESTLKFIEKYKDRKIQFVKENNDQESKTTIPIYTSDIYNFSCGQRFVTTPKIIASCYYHGITDPYDIVKVIRSHDFGSKDLRIWTDDIVAKDVSSFLLKLKQSNPISTNFTPTSYFFNLPYIPKDIQDLVFDNNDKLANKFVEWLIGTNKYSKKSRRLNEIKDYFKLFLPEFIGKCFYNIEHKNKISKNTINYFNSDLIQGQQVIISQYKLLSDEFDIHDLDIPKLVKLILEFLLIKELKRVNPDKNIELTFNWDIGSSRAYNIPLENKDSLRSFLVSRISILLEPNSDLLKSILLPVISDSIITTTGSDRFEFSIKIIEPDYTSNQKLLLVSSFNKKMINQLKEILKKTNDINKSITFIILKSNPSYYKHFNTVIYTGSKKYCENEYTKIKKCLHIKNIDPGPPWLKYMKKSIKNS